MICMLGGMMLAGLSACSGDDDATDVPDDGVKVRRITITQTEDAARQMTTRATLVEDNGLKASWTKDNDRLTYCNLMRTKYSEQTETHEPIFGNLTAVSTGASSQFTGDVACGDGDYLAVVYPATKFTRNDSYTIRLTGQDGTLEGLATNYHYVYGMAHVTSVTKTTANATMGKMKSLLTVCKFSFVEKGTKEDIPIQSLSISYYGDPTSVTYANKYPQSATVTIKADNDGTILMPSAVHATDADVSAPLSVTCSTAQEAVYVALLPTAAERTFNFTVTNANGTYTGKANATLNEGEYVVATGLKLTKQQATKE